MSHARILFRADARERVLRGATTLADAVRVTLGPLASAFAVWCPFSNWLKLPSEKASSAESVGTFRLG